MHTRLPPHSLSSVHGVSGGLHVPVVRQTSDWSSTFTPTKAFGRPLQHWLPGTSWQNAPLSVSGALQSWQVFVCESPSGHCGALVQHRASRVQLSPGGLHSRQAPASPQRSSLPQAPQLPPQPSEPQVAPSQTGTPRTPWAACRARWGAWVNPYLIARPLLGREAILSSRMEGTRTTAARLVSLEADAVTLRAQGFSSFSASRRRIVSRETIAGSMRRTNSAASKSNVDRARPAYRMVVELERLQLIRRQPGVARSIDLLVASALIPALECPGAQPSHSPAARY
jgi:hypothetical protein